MKLLSIGLTVMLAVSLGFPAYTEVRFGKNVRVGGHDFSNQTFNSKRRGKIYLYEGKPRNEGCDWRKGKNGERVKVCHLQTKKKRK